MLVSQPRCIPPRPNIRPIRTTPAGSFDDLHALLRSALSVEVSPHNRPQPHPEPLPWPLILVTGATGYIGSHVVLELLRSGKWGVIALDNLSNSGRESLRRVRKLAGPACPPLFFHQLDLRDVEGLSKLFARYRLASGKSAIGHVMHFAALKSVSGSHRAPEAYHSTNVTGTAALLGAMAAAGVRSLVFSSSAVVYGAGQPGLLAEEACTVTSAGASAAAHRRLTSPYGATKLRCEELVQAACASSSGLKAVILRYSNPSGNDPSGMIGDSPREAENLMPIVCQVLQGLRDHVCIFGKDYETRDGTGVRDFIHVQDLARGHLAALEGFLGVDQGWGGADRCRTYNLSTGQGATVKEIIDALVQVSGQTIRSVDADRRPGDLAIVICDPTKASKELGWKAEKTILDMARDMWTYCLKNPNGLIS